MALDFHLAHIVDPSEFSPIVLRVVKCFIGTDTSQHPYGNNNNNNDNNNSVALIQGSISFTLG